MTILASSTLISVVAAAAMSFGAPVRSPALLETGAEVAVSISSHTSAPASVLTRSTFLRSSTPAGAGLFGRTLIQSAAMSTLYLTCDLPEGPGSYGCYARGASGYDYVWSGAEEYYDSGSDSWAEVYCYFRPTWVTVFVMNGNTVVDERSLLACQ